MNPLDFYTDRHDVHSRVATESLSPTAIKGLLNIVSNKITSDWFASEFPHPCPDGNDVVGTNVAALRIDIEAVIPTLQNPFETAANPDQGDVFDLVEYAAQRVAKPKKGRHHEYFHHYELTFSRSKGLAEFRQAINTVLYRNGAAYELSAGSQVHRVGTPEVQEAIGQLLPDTGDSILDALIRDGRSRYQSRERSERQLGIEKLWDAFERMKTIDEPTSDKKASVARLLANFAPEAWRETVEAEMRALTLIGNRFAIRHHETDAVPLNPHAEDYFFCRMSNLLALLMRGSNRFGA